jgi:hypothetical protein
MLQADRTREPCAELLISVQKEVRPHDDGVAERLVEFAENMLPHLPTDTSALPLIATLAFVNWKTARPHLARARMIVQQREARESNRQKARERFQNLLSDVVWPPQAMSLTGFDRNTFTRAREISHVSVGHAGTFHCEKLNRSVHYESQLEHDFLICLEQSEEVPFYQEQPLAVKYKVRRRERPYYPDVLFVLASGQGVLVEIKPIFQMALKENALKWEALQEFCLQTGLGLLITDGRRSIQSVRRHQIKPQFEEAVLSALQSGPLSWTKYRQLKDQFQPGRDDFVALVLNNGLVWQLRPFSLSSAS